MSLQCVDTLAAILRASRKTSKIAVASFLYFKMLHFLEGFWMKLTNWKLCYSVRTVSAVSCHGMTMKSHKWFKHVTYHLCGPHKGPVTVYLVKYAHCCRALFCCHFLVDSPGQFACIPQGSFTVTRATIWLPQCLKYLDKFAQSTNCVHNSWKIMYVEIWCFIDYDIESISKHCGRCFMNRHASYVQKWHFM